MWTIRFLNGPRAGESIELKQRQIIGRDESSDIVIQDSGVSKKHAEIIVESGQITLKDLGSSNGTYVNGIRIRSHDLNIGDKIAFYQVIAEFGLAQESLRVPVARSSSISNNMQIDKVQNRTLVNSSRNVLPSDSQSESISESSHGLQSSNALSLKKIDSPDKIVETAAEFINEKVMPNVFSMTEQLSFKTVFLGIMIIFLLTVTILSVIPLYLVTSESVQSEAFLRALSVARSVAQVNEARIRSGDLQKFSTDLLFQEKGIEDIYIIGRDGVVIAPLEQSGSAPKHVGFARQVRGQPREFVTSSLDRVLAAVPIIAFDSDQQVNIAKAHVIVSYHPKTLAFDDAKIFSLFIQVLVIGVIVGGFLFYILYKLIEHVFRQIYQKLDEAIRSGADQISLNFNFPILSDLLTIINSLLVRAQSANQSVNPQFVTRMNEYISICNMIPYPSLIVRYDRIIQHINGAFAHLINMTEVQLQNHSINEIPDSALQQNLNYLIDQATLNPHQVYSDTLDMGGHIFSINCQAVRIESDQIDHFVISISPHEGTSS
jgi:pSer/pThr/pTyr-binding forkhead associated (FHA) protein